MEGTAKPPPAGWYPDPDDGALQRFWDGSRWTSSRMPQTEAVPLETAEPKPDEGGRYAGDAAKAEGGDLRPAAWYADPDNPSGMRYWDGSRWTEDRTDYRPAPAQPKPKREASQGMVVAGYILSFLFPLAGVVIGVMLMGRGNSNGRWVLILSLLFIAVFLAIGDVGQFNNR